jgi:hypothetical protein
VVVRQTIVYPARVLYLLHRCGRDPKMSLVTRRTVSWMATAKTACLSPVAMIVFAGVLVTTTSCFETTPYGSDDDTIDTSADSDTGSRSAEDTSSFSDTAIIRCDPPETPANGGILETTDRFKLGSIVTYACKESYTLIGKADRTCLSDGRWSDEAPYCRFDGCPDPGGIANGRVELPSEIRYNSVASYICDVGYVIADAPSNISRAIRICRTDGYWDAVPPSCVPLDCGLPPEIDNAASEYTSTVFGASVIYTCLTGAIGEAWPVFCLADGTWSSPKPECLLEQSDPVESTAKGNVR